jgi:hypothetical protein
VRRDDGAGHHRLSRSRRRDQHSDVVSGQVGDGLTLGSGKRELPLYARRALVGEAARLGGEVGYGVEHAVRQNQSAVETLIVDVRERHRGCRLHRWSLGGQRTLHCGYCCPMPPLSVEQAERTR